jgi:hypothetical protein
MMSWLSALGAAAADQAGRAMQRIASKALLWLVGGALMLVALGFMTAALYTVIADRLGPVPAQLILAGIFAFVGIVIVLIAALSGRRPPPPDGVAALDPTGELGLGKGRPAGLAAVTAAFAFGFARGLLRRRR